MIILNMVSILVVVIFTLLAIGASVEDRGLPASIAFDKCFRAVFVLWLVFYVPIYLLLHSGII